MWLRVLLLLMVLPCVVYAGTSVDINRADAVQIASALEGIGQKKAEKIVAWRKEHGPFNSAADVAKVPGIGTKLVERNKALIQWGHQSGASINAQGTRQSEKGDLSLPVGAYSSR